MNRFAICNETFGDWPLEKALETAANLGYRGWEVAPFVLKTDARLITAAQREQYRRTVESFGLEVIGLHWLLAKTNGFHLTTDDAVVRKATSTYFEDLIRLCADLGGKVMVLGSPQQRNLVAGVTLEQAHQNAAEVLSPLHDSLEKYDVRIALEPLGPQEGNFLNTADEARQLKQRIPSDRVGLHLDVKAMSTEPEPIVDVIRKHADWLLHFHANDPNRRGPGMGEVDFQPILKTLHDVGYRGWISVEVFDYSLGAERLAADSMETLKRHSPAIAS
ncbi:MAG: sugar phosphate isomerase/epimerase family protein [Planctomycetaceae bacterium]